ncbi:MAG: response regulator [Nitrospirae bacterium]|nr:response regulator [Nitrospirota bacterium]
MTDTVIFVDDEEYVRKSIDRLFSDIDMRVLSASNADEALNHFQKQEIAVIVSDNQMPGMKGIDLLSRIKEISPDTMKILMTGSADLATAVDAINRGEVFRFITKPWEDDALIQTVQEAIKRYQIVQSLKKEDESTLLSLAQTIELKDPYTRGHCESVARYAIMIADALKLADEVKKDIRYGSWLHDCGKIGVPENILNKNGPLDENEFEIIRKHPRWGADVAVQARMSDTIVNIILHHHERYDGSGYPSAIQGHTIPFTARIVTIADVFDALTSDRPYRKRFDLDKAVQIMRMMEGNVFDPEILYVFLQDCLNIGR